MLNVAIAAGGDSGEYEISMQSARQVLLHIDRKRYNPYLIVIRGKNWFCHDGRKRYRVDKDDFSLTVGRKKIRFDRVFNAIHGTPGENGKLQGYLDMLGIPYTSCDVTTSALTFNKAYCKDVVSSFGVKTAKSLLFIGKETGMAKRILAELSLPLFIKPNNGGSSVGMSKVTDGKELPAALDKAFREDDQVIVEEFVSGRELTCGVMRTGRKILALPVTEIISRKEYFDFEAKYQKGLADEVVPAQVPEKVSSECRAISEMLYGKLNCRGVVRFDYIFTGKNFFFLEVNTVPGMSKASIVPRMARAQGWTFGELVSSLLDEIG